MKIKTAQKGDVAVLSVSGKVMGGPDHETFHEEVKRLLADGHRNVLLDFGKVPWINSTGLGIIISGYASIKQAGGRLMICNLNERVLSLFYTARIHDLFEVKESTEKALAAFAGD